MKCAELCFVLISVWSGITFVQGEAFEYECDILQRLDSLESKNKDTAQMLANLETKVNASDKVIADLERVNNDLESKVNAQAQLIIGLTNKVANLEGKFIVRCIPYGSCDQRIENVADIYSDGCIQVSFTSLTSSTTHSIPTTTKSTTTVTQSTSTTTSSTTTPTEPVYDCYDILTSNKSSGVDGFYTIYFNDGNSPTHAETVYCNMSSGGWTAFLYRIDESVDLDRNFLNYENGFGQSNTSGSYWLGLKWLHFMTTHKRYELRIDVTFTNGTVGQLGYTTFRVGPSINYTLTVEGFDHGFPYDAMAYHNGISFTTKDVEPYTRCANLYSSGWWYNNCYNVNLTGKYGQSFAIFTQPRDGAGHLLTNATMSMRPL